MKRFVSILIAALLCLSSCGSGEKSSFPDGSTCESIMQAAVDATEAPVAEIVYTDTEGNLDSYTLSLLADAEYKECPEYELLDGYAIYISLGAVTYEVAVLKAKDEAALDGLYQLVERRKSTMSSGDKAFYDRNFDAVMSDSVLYTDGLYVIFLLTEDNDSAKEAIEKLKA